MSDPLLLQKAIRQNTNDLIEFSKDLQSWGEDMNRKEEALKKSNESSSASKNLRKVLKGERKAKTSKNPKTPAPRIAGTNYAAWDKFDVDAELEKLEEDVKDDSDLTDECNESMYDEAIVEKEKGNKFVKNQEWEQAIKSYTKAIQCYSYDPIFYANRALCYLKLSKYDEAENDCNLSIKLDDTYVKAYQRRAAARLKLNKLEHAEVDLQKVLIMEPNNKESKAELLKLSVLLKRDKEARDQRPISKFTASRNKSNTSNTMNPTYNSPKTQNKEEDKIDDSKPIFIWPSVNNIIEVKPINKPPHLRSQKPLKRIEITEVDGVENETKVNTPIAASEKAQKEDIIKEHVLEKQANGKNLQESQRPTSVFNKQRSSKVEPDYNDSFFPKPEGKLVTLKTEDLKVVEKTNPLSTPKDIKNNVNDNKKLTESIESNDYFAYPKNSVQFYTSWKNFKSSADKYKYLKTIEPRDIPKLFLNSLDSVTFSSILEVLAKHFIENGDEIFDILDYFAQVKRFSALVMFMSNEDKSYVLKLLDYIKENREKEDVDKLIKKFEL